MCSVSLDYRTGKDEYDGKCPSHCNFPLFLGGKEHVQEAPLRSSSVRARLDVHVKDLKVCLFVW